jgi:hypothetical protein
MLTTTWFSLGLVVLTTAIVVLVGLMPILAHGVIDRIGFILIYFTQDTDLKIFLWKEKA